MKTIYQKMMSTAYPREEFERDAIDEVGLRYDTDARSLFNASYEKSCGDKHLTLFELFENVPNDDEVLVDALF